MLLVITKTSFVAIQIIWAWCFGVSIASKCNVIKLKPIQYAEGDMVCELMERKFLLQ